MSDLFTGILVAAFVLGFLAFHDETIKQGGTIWTTLKVVGLFWIVGSLLALLLVLPFKLLGL